MKVLYVITDILQYVHMRRGDIYRVSDDITLVKGPGEHDFIVREPKPGIDSSGPVQNRKIVVEGGLGIRVDNAMGGPPGRKEVIIR